jgi:hypothetical protein
MGVPELCKDAATGTVAPSAAPAGRSRLPFIEGFDRSCQHSPPFLGTIIDILDHGVLMMIYPTRWQWPCVVICARCEPEPTMRPTLTQTRREMARGSRDALATMLLLTGPREDHHVPLPRHRSILLSPQASAAGGFL